MNRKRVIAAVIGVLISLLLLVLMVRELELRELTDALALVSIPVLMLSLISRGAAFVFMAFRTRTLLGEGTSVSMLIKSHLAGFAGNNLLPFRLGELVRIDWQSRGTGLPRSHLLATAGIERLLDLFVLFSFFLVMTPLAIGDIPRSGAIAALGVMLLAAPVLVLIVVKRSAWFLSLIEWLLRPLGQRASSFVLERSAAFFEGLSALSSPHKVVGSVLLSLGYWSMTLVSIQIWISAFGLDLPWYAPLFVTGFLAFGTAIPSAPGFVGTWHYLCRTALISLGVAEATAVAFAFVGHFMAVVPFTIISVVVLGGSGLASGLRLLGNGPEKENANE